MRRVLIIGSGGAGKSTFARRLGAALGIEVIHLDQHYWRPRWTEPSDQEWAEQVEELLVRDAWVMDGNFGGTLERRIQSADAVLLLDVAPAVCLWRVTRRRFAHRRATRADMAPDCPERLSWQFVKWVWTYRKRRLPRVLELLARYAHGRRCEVLRTRRDLERILADVSPDG